MVVLVTRDDVVVVRVFELMGLAVGR